MKSLQVVLIVAWHLLGAVNSFAQDSTKERLSHLTYEVIQIARSEPGIGQEAQELTKELEALDHVLVAEAMLPLLKHEKTGVPKLASYIILKCKDGLSPEHLDLLKEGYRNGGGWLPNAIASLDTDEAAEFLAKEFRANPKTHGQVDWALISMGQRAVPYMLKEFDDADPEHEKKFFAGLRHIFRGDQVFDGLKGKAQIAIPHLMIIAESENVDLRRRQEAIRLVGCVGKEALPYFPRLRALTQKDPDNFDNAVTQAIIASETSSTAEILADKVEAGADYYTVREIALLGIEAKNVGPRVANWQDNPNWEVRVMSARTLGSINYRGAITLLEGLLSSKADWRLAYVSTKSLAELQAIESISALEETSQNYWFPIVRNSAKNALNKIQKGEELERHGFTSAADLVDYIFIDRDDLTLGDSELQNLMPQRHSADRRTSFSDFKDREPDMANKIIDIRQTNGADMLKTYSTIIEFPLDVGVLLGATAGEWTGGLHYLPKEGDNQLLLHENITDIKNWKGRVFVSSGIYHMGMNEGMLHEVVFEDDKIAIEPWFVLPGLPTSMWVTEDEKLIVICVGGTLAFSNDGEFRYYGSEASGHNNTKD